MTIKYTLTTPEPLYLSLVHAHSARSKGCGVKGRTDVSGDGGGKLKFGGAINRAGEHGRGALSQSHAACALVAHCSRATHSVASLIF